MTVIKQKQSVGFTQVSNNVLKNPLMSLKAKGLFSYLYSKPDGWDFSARRIADELKESEKTVRAILKELESYEYLVRNREGSGRMTYHLFHSLEDTLIEPCGKNNLVGQKPCGKNDLGQKRLGAVSTAVSNTDKQVIKKEQSNKEITKKMEIKISEPLPVPEELWNDWLKHRKEIGKPLKGTAMKSHIKLLNEYPNQAQEIIRTSINGGWQGLFPPKGAVAVSKRKEVTIIN